jgi:hypothetical protein
MKPPHILAVAVLAIFLGVGVLWASQHFRVIEHPSGAILLARFRVIVGAGRMRYRPYVVGTDSIVRMDFDEDRDGDFDLRCDGAREGMYTACSSLTNGGWAGCPVSRCERAWAESQGKTPSDTSHQ